MNSKSRRTVTLGSEYDKLTRDALRDVLLDFGVSLHKKTWGLGGSQEVETVIVDIRGHELIVENETYIGLTITGDNNLVTSIASRVAERIESKKDRSS